VRGLLELQRAFQLVSAETGRDLAGELRKAGEPVRLKAEDLAVGNIRNIGNRWSRMRIGGTSRTVYVAPASRRAGGSPRPNLAPLLMTRSMEPALAAEGPQVEARLEAMLDRIGAAAGF